MPSWHEILTLAAPVTDDESTAILRYVLDYWIPQVGGRFLWISSTQFSWEVDHRDPQDHGVRPEDALWAIRQDVRRFWDGLKNTPPAFKADWKAVNPAPPRNAWERLLADLI